MAIEYLIFTDLCRTLPASGCRAGLRGIQAGFAFESECVDIGPLLLKLRPPGYPGLDAGYAPAIGTSGLAFFHWIYDVELAERGEDIRHTYQNHPQTRPAHNSGHPQDRPQPR